MACFKSSGPEDPRGIVYEAPIVQCADPAPLQIFVSSKGIDQRAEAMPLEAGRHCVDAEVTAAEIFDQRGRPDIRKGGRLRIALGPGGSQVERDPPGKAKPSGSESRVRRHHRPEATAQVSSHGNSIALHDQIDIAGVKADEQVPDIPANNIERAGCGNLASGFKGPSDFGMEVTKPREPLQSSARERVDS